MPTTSGRHTTRPSRRSTPTSGSSSTTTSPSRRRPARSAPRWPSWSRPTWSRRSLAEVRELKNVRSATLDLDSLYGAPAPADPDNAAKMKIGKVSDTGSTDFPLKKPKGKTKDNDLPRQQRDRQRPAGRPGGADRRPAQRREHDHLPAPPGLPQGAQRPGRRGAYADPGPAGAAPALPAHRDPRLPEADRRPGDRQQDHQGREPVVQRARRAVLHAAGVRRRRVPLRAHHGRAETTTSTSTSTPAARTGRSRPTSTCSSPSRRCPANSVTSTPCRTTGSSSGSASSTAPTGQAGKARKFDTALASVGRLQSVRPDLGDRRAGDTASGRAPARGAQPAPRLPAADADRPGGREAPGPAGAHCGAAARHGDQRRGSASGSSPS